MSVALVVLVLAAAAPAVEPAPAAEETRTYMAELVEGVKALQPYFGSEDAFTADKNEVVIRGWLEKLAASADGLRHTDRARVATFSVSAKVLGEHLDRTRAVFVSGHKEDARWMMQATFRTCISCHSQLPSAPGKALLEVPKIGIDQMTRAEFFFASRQFDAAAEAYRKVIADFRWFPQNQVTTRARVEFERAVERLLLVQIRVRRDLKGAAADVEVIATQRGLPEPITKRLDAWRKSLARKDLLPPFDPNAAEPAKVLAWASPRCGKEVGETPSSWDAYRTVSMLLASGVIYELLARAPDSPVVPEALVAAARCEAGLGRDFEVPLSDLYLEECVHRAPHTDGARKCLKELRQYLAHGDGARGLTIDRQRLDALEELAAPAQAGASEPARTR